MSKEQEELYTALINNGRISLTGKAILDEFFDSHVCIPKGENRHPYADVLHEAIEGTNIQELQCNEWCDVLVQDGINSLSKYRIKPSEPVYEYLWYDADGDTKWLTLDEAKEFERPWFWAKETGRMRQ